MSLLVLRSPGWLVVPAIILLSCWLRRHQPLETLALPSLTGMPLSSSAYERLRPLVLGCLFWLAVLSLALAAAGPQRDLGSVSTSLARNIVLALDVSRSMSAADFTTESGTTSRMDGVKAVVAEFLARRPHDRIGLVVFGSKSYVQAPLTLDHDFIAEILAGLEVGVAGDGTAIGDGLGTSLKRIAELPAPSKSIVLVTDGANNSGSVAPLSAANVAKDLGVRVYTIGIGSKEPITVGYQGGLFGSQAVQRVEFDEATLQQIAAITGGRYQNASSLAGLREVYHEIDNLERSASDGATQHEYKELGGYFAALGGACLLLFWLLRHSIFRVVP